MSAIKWKYKGEVSDFWYLAGLFSSIGYIVAMIYMLLTNDKNRVFSLLYLLGIIGGLITYFIFKKKDERFADLSKKLVIGNVLFLVLALFLVFEFVIITP